MHINGLELLAGSFAVGSFTQKRMKCCVMLRMDNISAVQYVSKMGGPHSKDLADLVKEFWGYCLSIGISVVAQHIPGLSNGIADWFSRNFRDSSNWRLNREIFLHIQHLWGPFNIDLFADRLNTQLTQFFSCWGRCIPTRLERPEAICLPSICHATQVSPTNSEIQGNSSTGNSILEIPNMVPDKPGNVNRLPSTLTTFQDTSYRPPRGITSSGRRRIPHTDGMEDFRRQWEIPGLSPDAFRLIS